MENQSKINCKIFFIKYQKLEYTFNIKPLKMIENRRNL